MGSYKDPHDEAADASPRVVVDEVTIWEPGMYDDDVTLRVPIFELLCSNAEKPPASITSFETPNRLTDRKAA
jgi:hypothetical protein